MMESIEKLRDCTFIGGGKVNEYLDEIEREIESRYMELPVDADGVPIHCGERMRLDNGHEGDVWLIGVFDIMMSDHTCFDWAKSRHVKQRTVEGVLREFAYRVNEYLDEIEREIESRYMELPVDADGVPIHVGDLVALNYGEPFKVGGIRDAGNQWHIFRYELNRWWSPLDLHHVKPRTVEDVLCDMIHEYACSDMTTEQTAAKYAAEIRDLMEVDR